MKNFRPEGLNFQTDSQLLCVQNSQKLIGAVFFQMTVFKSESNYLKTAQSFLSQKIVPFEKDQISFYYPGNLPAVQLVKAGNALSRAESMSGKQASS